MERGWCRVRWGGTGWDGVGRGGTGLDGVGQGREACFGLELKADQIYRCDNTITHCRVEDSSGALLSHSLLKKCTDQIN